MTNYFTHSGIKYLVLRLYKMRGVVRIHGITLDGLRETRARIEDVQFYANAR
jgi:hypothetical protein